ncbi:D-inositol 3-phosphate glycosyltransferase [Paraburkholderia caffeinitolerans]|uniref:D-inositol 3-phosphate glycosyltransferase n=1 Tax=Paraburkholderia caffeinitolerans TaxID=1723730 RepID=A0A6J5FF75_9BURK|nr:glycosyltransferase [Paraburkholderia caffeinitolerans]CAB3776363.1 D-inositol 3-phosphate glycosyltransferase [Paraburkholderia caffeinitolerans]
MKVLFSTYPMAFHTPGGGEVQLLAYRKHLPLHNVEVTLFDQWEPRFLEYDVVHFFSCISGSAHFCHFVKRLGLPLVVSASLWITEATRHLYPIDEIRYQLDLADRVVTNSNIESDTLARVLDLPREKFSTVYNGIDEFFLKPGHPTAFREQHGLQQRFVLNVGNIEPRKNQLSLVRAMKAHPDVKLVLIGQQRDPEYSQAVLREGGDQVMYLGPMPHDDLLLSAYASCDLFCLPSTLETPGLAALEAAAQRAPLLITSEGSCEEYFGGHARYVPPGDDAVLAAALGEALAVSEPGAGSFNSADFTWARTTAELRDVYRELA